ncbi:hypothetical protein D3C71_1808770 [compost metagenome]
MHAGGVAVAAQHGFQPFNRLQVHERVEAVVGGRADFAFQFVQLLHGRAGIGVGHQHARRAAHAVPHPAEGDGAARDELQRPLHLDGGGRQEWKAPPGLVLAGLQVAGDGQLAARPQDGERRGFGVVV